MEDVNKCHCEELKSCGDCDHPLAHISCPSTEVQILSTPRGIQCEPDPCAKPQVCENGCQIENGQDIPYTCVPVPKEVSFAISDLNEIKRLRTELEMANQTICEKLELYSEMQSMILQLYFENNLGDNIKALTDIGLRIAPILEKYSKK